MTIYSEMQGVATELLTEFKQGVIQYVQIVPGSGPAYNPGPSQEIPVTINGATAGGISFKYVKMGLGVAGDMQINMAVQANITPAINGFVKIDGVQYKITQIIPKPAAGIPVTYTLIAKKGA
jgi:hypothetical protein